MANLEGSTLPRAVTGLALLGEPFMDYYDAFWSQTHLPPGILVLVAERLAQLHQVALVPLPPLEPCSEQVQALPRWHQAACFSDAERACLEFAEVYAQDCRAISDEQAEAVKQAFGDAGLVTLVQALGAFDSLLRLNAFLEAEVAHGN